MPAIFESLEPRRLLASAAVLDETFAVGGRASQPFADGRILGRQPDGKILITRVHHPGGGNELIRLNADGSPDPTFLGGSIRDFPLNSSYRINPLDGRIAYLSGRAFHVLRPDGTPDAAFDNDGVREIAEGESADDFEWQGSELLYMSPYFLRRLNADGSADSAFGTNGAVDVDENLTRLEVDADGRIYLVSDNYTAEADSVSRPKYTGSSKVTRLTASGDLDTSYGRGAGVVTVHSSFRAVSPGQTDFFRVQPDGTVFHTSALGEGGGRRALARTDPEGVIDLRHEYATAEESAGSADYFPALQRDLVRSQSDGKILFINRRLDGWQIGRLNADGSIDRDFANNGIATLDIEPQFSTEVPQLPDGKLLFGGRRAIEGGTFEVQRIIYAEGGDGADTLHGGQGDDVFLGGTGPDELFGHDGNDKLGGGGGNDYLLGGAGKDDLFGEGGDDTLSGAGGNDRLFGGPDSADRILGGAGNDAAADDEKDTYHSVETLLS